MMAILREAITKQKAESGFKEYLQYNIKQEKKHGY